MILFASLRLNQSLILISSVLFAMTSLSDARAFCKGGISVIDGERHGDTVELETILTRPDRQRKLRTWTVDIKIAKRCFRRSRSSKPVLKIKSASNTSQLIPQYGHHKGSLSDGVTTYQLRVDREVAASGETETVLVLVEGEKELDRIRIVRIHLMNWSSGFRLGVQYEGYSPNGAGSDQSLWHGPSVQFFLGSWIDQRNRRRPSHGQVYWKTSLLSRAEGGELSLIYGFGTQVSFEPDALRRWMIPTFGIDIGGIYGLNQETRSHSFQLTPQLGILIYSSPRFTISSRMGYILPMVSALERHRGFIGSLGASVDIW
ncbi:MAG: hypothetical protein VYA30_02010 [Myxococcota bacterium]|nr:hypothetical protein [Myxococcota bacterium]